jgi:hypothetical protein
MNVKLPMEALPWAGWGILGGSIFIAILGSIFLNIDGGRKKVKQPAGEALFPG